MNIFDNLPALAPPKAEELRSELDRYLTADIEHVTDPIKWWYKRRDMYPALVFEGPVLGPQKDQGLDRTGLI